MRFFRMVALLPLLGLVAATVAPKDGVPMKVTPQMRGAGRVSSGAVLPAPPPATGNAAAPVPSWGKPLPYPVVIADRRNNRLIEVAPNKRIIWEHPSPDLSFYRGNDDVFFAPDGKSLMVNEEDNYDIHLVDYATRDIVWSYGQPDTKGSGPDHFNFPDDSQILADGTVMTADIRNCRILFVERATSQVKAQWGTPGICRHDPPRFLAYPNGITPIANGDILVTEIPGALITRMTRAGRVVWSVSAPGLRYPSDAYPTHDGKLIVADYARPGKVVIFDPVTRKILWRYAVQQGEGMLDHPSLAEELPTGDVLLNDDWRNRVVVIDRATKKIVWQYGATDTAGHAPGYLFYPDGLDIDVFHDWKKALGVK